MKDPFVSHVDQFPDDRHPDGAQPLRLLVVDDSRLQRRILLSVLKDAPYLIEEAGSGEEALDICTAHMPDIVVSDWLMPGMSGLELCRRLREMGTDGYTYFIVLTSKSEKGELAQALREGADDFLSKPVSSEELRGRLAAGERLLSVQRELSRQNMVTTRAIERMRSLHEALDRDLVEARKLQMSLVPSAPTVVPGGQASYLLHSSGHVGGDLVGGFRLGATGLGVFSLDVSGHGIAAALITARLGTWLSGMTPGQNLALEWRDGRIAMARPSRICEKLNALFLDEIDTEHYFTICVGEIDLMTGRARFCQAGHPHPARIRADGRIDFVGEGGMPIGLIPGAHYEDFELTLDPGDRLLLYSDGISECPHPDGGLLDEEGLVRILSRHHERTGPDLLEALRAELSAMVGEGDMPDDVSAALIEYQPRPT